MAAWVGIFAASALVVTAYAAPARAEEWLIVPVTDASDPSGMQPAVSALERELTERGIATLSSKDAAARFERVESSPPKTLSDADVEEWSARSQRALGLLARNDYEGALDELAPAQETSRAYAELLNREPANAAVLLDTCLYTVRALLGVGKRATARVQAQECARLAPAAEPDVKMHPPDIRTFYEDVVDASRATGGALSIESEPAGCQARVNGRSFGSTPVRIGGLLAGAYVVQVECDERPGRLHHVDVERRTAELRVDAEFDDAVRTGDELWLRYSPLPTEAQHARDAKTLAGILDVDALLFVSSAEDRALGLALYEAGGDARSATSASDPEALSAPVDRLLGVVPAETIATRPPRGQFISGVSLASVGTASLLSSYALYALSTARLADEMVALPSNDNQARWLNTRFGMFYTGSIGAGLLVTAMPLALPYRARTPWWGWLAGGTGLALAATSIALAVTAPPEPNVSRVVDPQGYVDRARRTDGAFLAGVTAAPLLTMPLVYLLRRDDKRGRAELTPEIVVSRSGGFAAIRGIY